MNPQLPGPEESPRQFGLIDVFLFMAIAGACFALAPELGGDPVARTMFSLFLVFNVGCLMFGVTVLKNMQEQKKDGRDTVSNEQTQGTEKTSDERTDA